MVFKFKQRIGSRAQVMNGTAKITGGGLTKKHLKYNKRGKIVSKKASILAKKNNRLVNAGYITKKGVFGVIKKGGSSSITQELQKLRNKIYLSNNNNNLSEGVSEDVLGDSSEKSSKNSHKENIIKEQIKYLNELKQYSGELIKLQHNIRDKLDSFTLSIDEIKELHFLQNNFIKSLILLIANFRNKKYSIYNKNRFSSGFSRYINIKNLDSDINTQLLNSLYKYVRKKENIEIFKTSQNVNLKYVLELQYLLIPSSWYLFKQTIEVFNNTIQNNINRNIFSQIQHLDMYNKNPNIIYQLNILLDDNTIEYNTTILDKYLINSRNYDINLLLYILTIAKNIKKINYIKERNYNNTSNKIYGKLEGEIPIGFYKYTQLTHVQINDNNITGSLHTNIGNLTNLIVLDLYKNKLTGIIPESIGKLINLTQLNLSRNNLIGTIPETIGNLIKLKKLILNNNKLTGDIPLNITRLKELKEFKIKDNDLNYQNPLIIKHFGNLKYITDIQFFDIYKKIQKQKYPMINRILKSQKNTFFINAHGRILNDYFFVPPNLSIILTTTPGYGSFITYNEKISDMFDGKLIDLSPGVSYGNNRKKNQLRFFKSGDIINNISLNFLMNYKKDDNYTYEGGILNYFKVCDTTLSKINKSSNKAYITERHIKTGNISWPEITINSYNKCNLRDIVLKFKKKKGNYILLCNSCLNAGNSNHGSIIQAKGNSIIYKYNKLLNKKLFCFQDLYKKIINNNEHKKSRVQNFSSTIKNKSCYHEIIVKLQQQFNTKNKVSSIINKLYEDTKRGTMNISTKYTNTYHTKLDGILKHLYKLYNESEILNTGFFIELLKTLPDKVDTNTNKNFKQIYNKRVSSQQTIQKLFKQKR